MPFNNQAPNIQPSVKTIPAVRNENMVMIVPTAPAIVNRITKFEGIRPLALKKLKIALNKIPPITPAITSLTPRRNFFIYIIVPARIKSRNIKEAVYDAPIRFEMNQFFDSWLD